MKLGLALASSSAATIIREPFLVAISKGVCPSCKGKNEYLFHVVVSGDKYPSVKLQPYRITFKTRFIFTFLVFCKKKVKVTGTSS